MSGEITQRSFETIYADAPADQRERLREFRASHVARQATVNGVTWDYIDSGSGSETILLLVGGLRVADAAYRNIPMLEDEFRVITPSYPALSTMAALTDGLVGVLAAAGVDQAHVLAGSFGGMVAQVLVRRQPLRVAKLVLSTTTVLDTDSASRYRQSLDMLRPLPPETAADFAKDYMLRTVAPPENEMDFWRAYLDELYSYRINKAELISTYECLLDFAENYRFSPNDLAGWPGQILILESDDDATFDEAARASVRALYPQAQTYTFHGAGHSPGTTQRELYFRVVKDFLRSTE
jgi:pimeloyl-ACP methyl ester carboxylesterase